MENLTAFFDHLKKNGVHVTAHDFQLNGAKYGTLKVTLEGPEGFTREKEYKDKLAQVGIPPLAPKTGAKFSITTRKASPKGEQGKVTLHIPALAFEHAREIRRRF